MNTSFTCKESSGTSTPTTSGGQSLSHSPSQLFLSCFYTCHFRHLSCMLSHMRAHWHHPVNTIELVLPSSFGPQVHSPNGSAIFCTGDCRVSICFTIGHPFPPQNCPFPCGDLDYRVIPGSLRPPESSIQTTSRSVQRF